MQRLMHTGDSGELRRLWESRRRRELLTIDRRILPRSDGHILRVSAALYIAHENPCAKDMRSRGIDVNGMVSLHLFKTLGFVSVILEIVTSEARSDTLRIHTSHFQIKRCFDGKTLQVTLHTKFSENYLFLDN